MSYQDLRHILKDFQGKGIVTCLNPENQTGRIYRLRTRQGNERIALELVDICSSIDRAKTRMAVLEEVAKERYFETEPLTATRIKKLMRDTYSLALNHVLAALQFLEKHELIEVIDHTPKRDLKNHDVTNRGRAVLKQLCGK
jgi:DNA-binding PadR family transcriptional regulator